MSKKESMIGAGITGILNGSHPKGAPADDDFFMYRRGRPRSDEPNPNEGKVFRKTSIDLEVDLYKRIRDMSQEERVSIKDTIHRLLEIGYKSELKRLAKESA